MPTVLKEVKGYQIYSAAKGVSYVVGIGLNDSSGRIGFIRYLDESEALPDNYLDSRSSINMFKHVSEAAIDIDILRNESPVYAYYYSPTLAYLQTSSEPVGEGEA